MLDETGLHAAYGGTVHALVVEMRWSIVCKDAVLKAL
jgi:hypothetical protein